MDEPIKQLIAVGIVVVIAGLVFLAIKDTGIAETIVSKVESAITSINWTN